jgi:hypothetical protein
MKKNKQLIKHIRVKLEVIFKEFNNSYYKIKEHIKLAKIVNGILRIKLFNKKRISHNFETHVSKSKKVITEIKQSTKNNISISKNRPSKREDNKTTTMRELDMLFGDIDGPPFENETKIVKTNNIKAQITRPSLLSLKSVFKNYKTHSIITQKIDGITKKKMNLTNSYPKCPLNNLFDVEYEEIDKMHFIIGIENSKMFDKKTFVELSRDMRSKHDFTKGNLFPNKIGIEDIEENSSLFNLIRSEKVNYNRYIKMTKTHPLYRGKLLWWPKMFFELKYNSLNEYIRLLSFFEEHSRVMGVFKNDGWILAHNKYLCNSDVIEEHNTAFKIKPRNLLTLDLLYKNNTWYFGKEPNLQNFSKELLLDVFSFRNSYFKNKCVYRCYPIFEAENTLDSNTKLIGFEPRELREDRKHPNPIDITNSIVYQINNYLKFSNLSHMIQNSKREYYHFGTKIKNNTKYTHMDKLNPILTHVNDKVIDLGGGAINKTLGYLEPVKDKVMYVVSTDNDINVVINNLSNKSESLLKTDIGYLDFTKRYNEYNKIEKQLFIFDNIQKDKFNTILMINCINFALASKECLINLFDYLDLISKTNSKIIIRWMDLDTFQEKYNQLLRDKKENCIVIKSPHDSSFINIKLHEKTNRIYYKWAHEAPINENIIGKAELTDIFSEKKWKLVDYERHKNFNMINEYSTSWDLYFKSFSTIVFERTY